MDNEKGSNARNIGPMTLAVAAELRALIARKEYSASRLSREAKIPRATLHRTLKATRAIDVEDVYAICNFFSEDPGVLMDIAAANARRNVTSDPSPELISAIDAHMGVSQAERFAANEEIDAPFSNAADRVENVATLDDHRTAEADDELAAASDYSPDRGEEGEGYEA